MNGMWVRRGLAQKHPSYVPADVPSEGDRSAQWTLLGVMGSDAKLEGRFDITGSIQVECKVGGKLNVGGQLVIGARGSVHAEVQTVDAIIYGEYEGKMVATGSVEITPSGRVLGNIETNSLVISKGGVFNGNVAKLTEAEAEAGKTPVHLLKGKQLTSES